MSVDIGDGSPEEARWWAAILAPGQGWQATMALEHDTFWSPWSICLQSNLRFFLSQKVTSTIPPSPPPSAPSFSDATRFLDNLCIRHSVTDQSHAALAAVLLFPSMGGGQGLQLPAPTVSNCWTQCIIDSDQLRHDWVHQENHLDRLLTLSCNTRGMRPMLLSAFYDASIECNAVTPWLQGAVAAIDSLAGDKPNVLGRMLMDRLPEIAFLWLGASILGLQKRLLQDVRFGLIPIDLHSAAWSGTIQSFIQQPVSNPLVANGHVTRADECRLLFLSQSGSHNRVSICQWRPFGATPIQDVDIEIQIHAKCNGHGLQYQGFLWDCTKGKEASQPIGSMDICIPPSRLLTGHVEDAKQVHIFYRSLDREKESISKNATRNIFGWLRVEGYAPNEKDIWKHEWFEMDSNDEDEEQCESSSRSRPKSSSFGKSWMSASSIEIVNGEGQTGSPLGSFLHVSRNNQ
ncbi:hypothetical protein QBC33DRAFT_493032 [Phialemonium atrogriseum]|uniref:Uncharacterized protein n=1 Tax=Phialemonium atrogriseum TaxID=1093897 RepID=A0AAJ0C1G0_9PEZI|nr:uncharacterized protein QBC33DRAFT_493032 [Phialemonium atrogriseum]KAK1766927.1 hypothetical protein QBC33DRAFT_493032 [Phialemonium atrogriseum]